MTDQKPSASQLEDAYLLDQLANEYQRRGYQVTLVPEAQDLPPSLRRLRPNLLASRADDHVAVIVETKRPSSALRTTPDIEALRAEGWRLELNFAADPVPPIAAPDVVTARLREATQIANDHHKEAALLFVWAAVEEALRGLASRFAPHETGRKILPPDQAYSIGLLSGSQHRLLSSLRNLRNQAANNITSISIPDNVIRDSVNLIERMTCSTYVPPPIMADHVFAQLDPTHDVPEQVRHSFPHSDPIDQTDAAEHVRSLQFINKR
jgi:REase_AHJR-like